MDQRKRYQIFVSSTYDDLKDERGKVMETILSSDCFPAGMEMFPAMDEDVFEYIKRIIDDSDYYLLIIGGRYGSVDDSGVSWTEKEYDYAVSRGIPVLAFIHEDFTKLPDIKIDKGKNRRKLLVFINRVNKEKLIKKWSNKDDLALGVGISLKKVLDLHPRIGWVRSDSSDSGDFQKERNNLWKEISEHENRINTLEFTYKKKSEGNHALELSNQGTQYVIKNLKEQAKNLKEQVRNLKNQSKNLKEQSRILEVQEKNLETELGELKTLTVSIDMPKVLTKIFTVKDLSFKMVYVGGGVFNMGANDDRTAAPKEKPVHSVALSDYWIGETLVTQALWQAVMGKNPSRFKGDPNRPVERVSWADCKTFIRVLSELTGMAFRLPTEAEWEFAARGGNLGNDNEYKYAGSDNYDDVAWFNENTVSTRPVGEKNPNELGLYDMSGNVWEWCEDWYDSSYYSHSVLIDPKGPESRLGNSYDHVIRGGSWYNNSRVCGVSIRFCASQTDKQNTVGLRLAL